ncbi:MAG TPA: MerR family transcriptional regulator [Candidatus Eisenbergiella merdipullorum]|uniref:MerR family transcriptional regulator n=1 Tax=Candidatus Eisenbergiella merdipullorum TaxID=2838553 RepID=A0A9D2I548_9FIRM|nr:MerR family transcriptional regulator [Candidatus Eisenbergiella merdipullorum]
MKTEQEKKEEHYLISETARLVGVESHVLRYWEEELKLPIRRNELGHRYYTKEDVEQFREIKKLKEQGLQLKAIRTVLTADNSMQILMPISEKEVSQISGQAQKSQPAETEGKPLDTGEKAMRLQMLLHSLISQAVRENNEELTRQIRDTITKEMDYQFRAQEEENRKREQEHMEKEEEHFRKLDETLRLYAGKKGKTPPQNSLREKKRQRKEAEKAQKEADKVQRQERREAQKAAREAEAKSRKEAAKARREDMRTQKEQNRLQKVKEKKGRRNAETTNPL